MDWVEDFVDYVASNYSGKVAEIGIGRFTEVAERLTKYVEVIAVDIVPSVSEFRVIRDDIFSPRIELYRDVELVYSIRPPPELHVPILSLARKLKADAIIKPLGNEFPENMVLINHRRARFYIWKFPSDKGTK